MEQNFAAWMIAGGPRSEDPHAARDREQLHVFLESRRVARTARAEQLGLITRLRQIVQPNQSRPDPACCPA